MAKQAVAANKPSLWARVSTFINEVKAEMKKSTWPTRDEIWNSTSVVLFMLVVVGALIGVYDHVFQFVVFLLLKLG